MLVLTFVLLVAGVLASNHQDIIPQGVNAGRLTLTFSAADLDTCGTENSTGSAVTFWTYGVGYLYDRVGTCFNVNETFGSNTNTSDWWTTNPAGYDPSVNYSRIWYQQVNVSDHIKPGEVAGIYVLFYPGYDCSESGDRMGHPIYATSCQSAGGGTCNEAKYSIASFQLINEAIKIDGTFVAFWNENEKAHGAASSLAPMIWPSVAVLLLAMLFTAL